MAGISNLRAQYPQYSDLSNDEFAHAFHDKFYSDMPFQEFSKKIGYMKGADPSEYDPESKAYRTKYGATSGMSGTQKFMAGAGKAVVDTGRGVKQLALGAADLVAPRSQSLSDLVTGEPVSRYSQYAKQMDQIKAQDADLMSTGAGFVGNIAGNLASTLIPAAGAGAVAGKLGLSGAQAAMSGLINPTTLRAAIMGGAAVGGLQPTGTNDSRLLNMGVGAAGSALGYGVSKALGRIFQPVQSEASQAVKKSVQVLEDAGVPLDAAQKSGSTRLANVKRFLTDNPLTNGGQVAQFEKTATGFDKAALKTIGENADSATEAVMSRAAKRIGGVMDGVAKNNPIQVSNGLLNKLGTIEQTAAKELETPQAAVISRQISEILDKGQSGAIDGMAYKSVRESLGRLQGGMDSGVKYWSGQIKDALDDALKASLPKDDASALTLARTQWRNMEAIQKVIGSQEGQHISPAKLANALNTKGYGGKVAMVRGKGATDLMRLAKAGSTIIPDRFPQSGTAPRAALQLLVPGAVGAGVGYAKEGDLSGAAKYAAGGVALPYLLQRLMNSPGGINYLTNGLGTQAALPGYLQKVPSALLLQAASQ